MSNENMQWSGRTLGIIPDGNRRWAQMNGKSVTEAYRVASLRTLDAVNYFFDRGLSTIVVYGASLANVESRPRETFDILIDSFTEVYQRDFLDGRCQDVDFSFLGDLNCLSPIQSRKVVELTERPVQRSGKSCIFVLNYSLEWDLNEAIDSLAGEMLDGKMVLGNLPSKRVPQIDCTLRTAGEQRLSNFLMHKQLYSELIWIDKLWPDVNESDFDLITAEFVSRKRTFGA